MVKVAIIGMGWIGKLHAKWAQTIENCKLVAISDSNVKVLEEYKQKYGVETYTDYKDVLKRKDIDAVYIATPLLTHYQIATESLAAGKHVFCEKPLVVDPDQAKGLREAVRKSKLKFQVDFIQRFAISSQEAKLSIDNGEIGNILFLRANFRWFMKKHAQKHGQWAFDRSQGGGILLEASVHMWDAIRFWSGKEIIDVCCVAHENIVNGKPLEDNVVAVANLEGGGIACMDLSGSMPMDSPTDKRFEIIGDRGCIYLDEFRNYIMVNSEIGHETNPEDFITGIAYPDVLWHSKIEGGCVRSQREFIRCIEKDIEPSPGVDDGARACEISWAALKSLETKKLEKVVYGS